jgi:hypothetical protein
MQPTLPLEVGKVYHIYNRGINGCDLFANESDFQKFIAAYLKYVTPFVDTFAYALMKNHFHFLVRTKDLTEDEAFAELSNEKGWVKEPNVSHQLGHFCNSYAQYFNKKYNRTGTLFERAFKRKVIEEDNYFVRAVFYIHANPQHHHVTDDFKKYPHTSYHSLASEKPTKLCREEVWEWFGSKEEFVSFHNKYAIEFFGDDYAIE